MNWLMQISTHIFLFSFLGFKLRKQRSETKIMRIHSDRRLPNRKANLGIQGRVNSVACMRIERASDPLLERITAM